MTASAIISECGMYRYWLSRDGMNVQGVPSLQRIAFVMLNPSTADGTQDDATIRRLYTFAQGAPFVVVNLYAWRATKPADMFAVAEFVDTVGPENAMYLAMVAEMDCKIIAAWGAHAKPEDAQGFVDICTAFGKTVHCIGTNNNGSPKHPLYVASDTPIVPWVPNPKPDACYVCDGVGCLVCSRVKGAWS